MKSDRFTQFEAYAAAVIHADLRLKLPRLVQSQWELQTEGLGQISLQLGSEGSGIIAEGSAQQDGYTLFVPLAGLQYANGQALAEQRVLLMTPGGELAIASKVPHDWCSIVLPFEVLGQAPQVPQDFSYPPGTSLVVDVENGTMKRLRQALFEIAYALNSPIRFCGKRIAATRTARRLQTDCCSKEAIRADDGTSELESQRYH